jgi:hypothetical protein
MSEVSNIATKETTTRPTTNQQTVQPRKPSTQKEQQKDCPQRQATVSATTTLRSAKSTKLNETDAEASA